MLAPHVIDASIDRALYLDPDILIINPLTPLFDIVLGDCVFAAASHTDAVHPATALNNVRLNTNEVYFNTGVILMDMRRAKALIDPDEIFAFAMEHERKLLFLLQHRRDPHGHEACQSTHRPRRDLCFCHGARAKAALPRPGHLQRPVWRVHIARP